MKIKSRDFLRSSLIVSAGVVAERTAASFARTSPATDARVEILLAEEIGTINPDIYGHFAEHLGGVVYDGIWVGEKSRVPNIGGIRTALIDAMKRIKPPVIRWPGGCFADSYDWLMELDHEPHVRGVQISGPMRLSGRRMSLTDPGNTIQTTSERMSFFGSV